MKQILFIFLISLCIFKNLNANESISKLNNLYLNGILDKDVYFQSLNNLGIDTSNDIFINLFDLFSNQVLDINSYEKSISNLISISLNDKKITKIKQNKQLDFPYGFKVDRCVGEVDLCADLKKFEIVILNDDKELRHTDEFKKMLIADSSFTKVLREDTFYTGDNYKLILSLSHLQGMMINFVINGKFNDETFTAEKFLVEAKGSVFGRGTLLPIK
jgi:hypothetical protein